MSGENLLAEATGAQLISDAKEGNDTMPKVSVLVPVYNVERYLSECLDSLVNQTLKDIEIICINDGSTDNSLNILQKYAKWDARIKIINKNNTGYGHTMNIGIQEAQGDYIGILESDDFADANMFEALYGVASTAEADFAKSNYWEYKNHVSAFVRLLEDGPYKEVFTPKKDLLYSFIFKPTIWSAIYKRNFIFKNNIAFNETPGASFQDTSFNFKIFACAERAIFIEDAFVHYRQDNAASSVNQADKVYCVVDEYRKSAEFLEARHDLKGQLEYLLPALKWNTYQWNYRRISPDFKYEFLEKMMNDFQTLWESNAIHPAYWYYKEHLHDLIRIMLAKDVFLQEVYHAFQRKKLLLSALKYERQHYEKIYLYGAGKVGREMASYLQAHNVDFDGFIVADIDENPDTVFKKPVIALDAVSGRKENNVLVLMTVKETTQREMLPVLRERGFADIFAMNRELRGYLMQLDQYSIHQLVQYVFKK